MKPNLKDLDSQHCLFGAKTFILTCCLDVLTVWPEPEHLYICIFCLWNTPLTFFSVRPQGKTIVHFCSNAHRCHRVYGKLRLTRKRFATCLLQHSKLFEPGHPLCHSSGMSFIKPMWKGQTWNLMGLSHYCCYLLKDLIVWILFYKTCIDMIYYSHFIHSQHLNCDSISTCAFFFLRTTTRKAKEMSFPAWLN